MSSLFPRGNSERLRSSPHLEASPFPLQVNNTELVVCITGIPYTFTSYIDGQLLRISTSHTYVLQMRIYMNLSHLQ